MLASGILRRLLLRIVALALATLLLILLLVLLLLVLLLLLLLTLLLFEQTQGELEIALGGGRVRLRAQGVLVRFDGAAGVFGVEPRVAEVVKGVCGEAGRSMLRGLFEHLRRVRLLRAEVRRARVVLDERVTRLQPKRAVSRTDRVLGPALLPGGEGARGALARVETVGLERRSARRGGGSRGGTGGRRSGGRLRAGDSRQETAENSPCDEDKNSRRGQVGPA